MFVRADSSGDPRVYYSASDLKSAVECEWALMRKLDAKLGRIPMIDDVADAMLARASTLGGEHEARALARYRERFGEGVVEIETTGDRGDPGVLADARERTLAALDAGADVVFQATFLDEPAPDAVGRAHPRTAFVGFADFLIRDPASGDYEVWDTKLARTARVTALLQLAAYAAQLRRHGVGISDTVYLLLGDGTESAHRLRDIEPVHRDRVTRLLDMVESRLDDEGSLPWGAAGYTACGRCAWCAPEVERTRDVLLVAGMRTTQRARLAEAGIRTIDELAASDAAITGIGDRALTALRDQARMQIEGEAATADDRPTPASADADATPAGTLADAAQPAADAAPTQPGAEDASAAPARRVLHRVHDPQGLAALPAPDAGDLFFDFEGDPLWTADGVDWGIDYLWGIVDADERFTPLWAHDRAQEKRALVAFLDLVRRRRAEHPGMHIYHYADYERAHLQALCARYGVGEAALDELLREHVFVDLYPIVKRSIRISENSYSLKKLEPLYMGDELRESAVTTGADSVQAYVDYTMLRDAGRTADADALLAEIADYNRYDCVSTLRLRDWLLARADERGVARRPLLPVETPAEQALERLEDEVRARLSAPIEGVPASERSADETALALAGAAIEYHRREDKSYWWEHYNRHIAPIDDWADTRDVLVVETGRVERDWGVPPGRRVLSRDVRLRGRLAPGSRLGVGDQPFLMYDEPLPPIITDAPAGQRAEHSRGVRVLEIDVHGEDAEVLVCESAPDAGSVWHELPVALTPAAPIPTKAQREAILHWGATLAEHLASEPDVWPRSAALDILRRVPPRTVDGHPLDRAGAEGVPAAIVRSLQRLDDSYVAVQGPPGSGKTYVGAKVVARLVRELGWRVGVVAQSHDVVENVLRRLVEAEGLDPAAVAKKPRSGRESEPAPWSVLADNSAVAAFVQERSGSGFVLGGTAWDFANPGKVPRGSLDLLVIDEAGQYSLANTIAVSVAARRLLLLGDPQQLPQVSTGLHPEPVDSSALGWLADGRDVLPEEFGYFLEETWRMHPALTRAVSDLSYEGRLRPRIPETTDRHLEGVEPGLHSVPVEHEGYSTENPKEASVVVDLVRRLLGAAWTDPSEPTDPTDPPVRTHPTRPLAARDVIVVAPYNAQVELIRERLVECGLGDVPVGTVDRFQGQEAAIAIVSLTASSAADVPRGINFLLQRNRLNVAISRGKWAAYLVHSPDLRDHLPARPAALAELSAFLRLTAGDENPGRGR